MVVHLFSASLFYNPKKLTVNFFVNIGSIFYNYVYIEFELSYKYSIFYIFICTLITHQ
jgi:hypothetical protein